MNAAIHILGTGAALCAFLLVVRAQVVRFKWSSLAALPELLAAGYYDFLFVAGLTIVFLAALVVRRGQRIVCRLYTVAALLTLVVALVNVKVVAVIGRPFTYQWLYYSDFLRSLDARRAVGAAVSWQTAGFAALVVAALLASAWLARRGLAAVQRRWVGGVRFFAYFAVPCVLYFPLANWQLQHCQWQQHKLASPVVSFAESMLVRRPVALFTMETPLGPEDVQISAERPAKSPAATARSDRPIRNVVLFVLESVPAEYLEAYGGKYPVTPELNRYRPQAQLFRNIYGHAPATCQAAVSLLCGVYPPVCFQSLTQTAPDANLPSLVSELKGRGYRTAFFSSSDNQYQGLGRFLAHRQFDVLEDYRTLVCERARYVSENWNRDFLDGVDDECAVDALVKWVDAEPDRPFLGVVWTMMTHYPYFVSRPETDYGVGDDYFNRYLNALRHGDDCFGKTMRALEKRQLADSTLVVVVGDHGEAFGRHHQWAHAGKIYEENLHVPLLLINRRLFHGEESEVLGGLIDIAPTVMELMQLPSSPRWQGRSLLGDDRPARIYFFAPWSDFLFGYREGDHKYIYNATTRQYEVYNLRADPLETTNLAAESPDLVATVPHRLAAWVQYQDKLFQKALTHRPNTSSPNL